MNENIKILVEETLLILTGSFNNKDYRISQSISMLRDVIKLNEFIQQKGGNYEKC